MNKILHIALMGILIAGTIVLLAFTEREHKRKTYKSLHAEILNPSAQSMINMEEIYALVEGKFGTIEGSPITATDLNELEHAVIANPYVSKCEVYQTIEGILEMKVVVREPLVRIINQEDEHFYIDYNGYAMPLSPAHPSHVIVANGRIHARFISLDKAEKPISLFPDSSFVRQIYPVAWYISQDEFLSSFIDQIYINENKEMELVPKIGSQIILFGNADNAKEKLENLRTFYLKAMSHMDWSVYKTINLKYKNQVVCSKYN